MSQKPPKPFHTWAEYHEEIRTRWADRRAADPEEFQRRQKAERERNQAMWDRYKEKNDIIQANTAMAEELAASIHFNSAVVPGWSRLHDIWSAVRSFEMGLESWHQMTQADRIKATERQRVRGCGAAAKRAGFAG